MEHTCIKYSIEGQQGMLVKNFTCRDFDLWKQLNISLVRPHIEFASSVWNSYRQQDISIPEMVQRRASKFPLG